MRLISRKEHEVLIWISNGSLEFEFVCLYENSKCRSMKDDQGFLHEGDCGLLLWIYDDVEHYCGKTRLISSGIVDFYWDGDNVLWDFSMFGIRLDEL